MKLLKYSALLVFGVLLMSKMLLLVSCELSIGKGTSNQDFDGSFFNIRQKKRLKDINSKLENSILKSKVEVLGQILKKHVNALRDTHKKQVDLLFLVDASASVGAENFVSELRFVQKLLSDFSVAQNSTRVAVITFSSRDQVVRHIDHITSPASSNHKCGLLHQELPSIQYSGGGTYTLGALLEAQAVLSQARPEARRAIFLITDGFSNGGDPIPVAQQLKESGVLIFTFGIQNGNIRELYDMASQPGEQYSYILDSFGEFAALVRRALHQDLKSGSYQLLDSSTYCDHLCSGKTDCCDERALCSCGTDTGHYSCLCPPGFCGSGLKGTCKRCPNGTYSDGSVPGDESVCVPCPDPNHVTLGVASSIHDCQCKKGFTLQNNKCQVIKCPELSPPSKGYFVKKLCVNVLNAACGVRCRVGYQLIGSSIRLCQENGSWSGTESQCVVKTCSALKAPKNGDLRCSTTEHVIDTECEFSCSQGHLLVGSRLRNCLPLARWDGLQTTCKPLYCPPLPTLSNGMISPVECVVSKQVYNTQCNISCSQGFQLRGPKSRTCGGRGGTWSGKNANNKCVDVTPPIIHCPEDIVVGNDLNEDFATKINWTLPISADNSGLAPLVWTKPAIKKPIKMKIGSTKVTYIAADASRNRARCNFTITVEDREAPMVDRCESPPPFLSDSNNIVLSWEPPQFHDNSGKPIKVIRTPDVDIFSYGITEVTYIATDLSGNIITCVINITLEENVCRDAVDPINGHANCTTQPEAVHCTLTCLEGYAFAMQPRDYFCFYDDSGTVIAPDNDIDPFPDCSVSVLSNSIAQDGLMTLEGDETLCQDPEFLNQVERHIRDEITKRLAEVCGNDVKCNVSEMASKCDQILSQVEEESNLISRKRRKAANNEYYARNSGYKDVNFVPSTEASMLSLNKERQLNQTLYVVEPTEATIARSRNKIEVHFLIIGHLKKNSTNSSSINILDSGMQKVKDDLHRSPKRGTVFHIGHRRKPLKVKAVSLNNSPWLICEGGSVLRGKFCVKCPVGTFLNNSSCESCKVGEYQDIEGQTSCISCPPGTSTRRTHAKSLMECKSLCPPGCFGRKRKLHLFKVPGLKPCKTCDVGTYQNKSGQTECDQCPSNTTTLRRGAKVPLDCIGMCPPGFVSPSGLEPCIACPEGLRQPLPGQKACFDPGSNELLPVNECFTLPCLNNGSCNPVGHQYFSCDCLPGFVGSLCEVPVRECDSNPCFHGGTCQESGSGYTCICPLGYDGVSCQNDVDECLSNPCLNNAVCVDSINSFICLCPDGFQGLMCEENIDECSGSYCMNGGSCVDGVANYSCVCPNGFSGLHCEHEPFDPCGDWPCLNGATCHSSDSNYSCECLEGYEGRHCEIDVDDCDKSPCENNATCLDLPGNYTCVCPPSHSGRHCEATLPTEFFLHFLTSGTTDYVVMKGPQKPLDEVTMCVWLRSNDLFNYGTVFSYASLEHDNSFTLSDYNGFVLYVNGQRVITDITANDGLWHFTCVVWSSVAGDWGIYIDGVLGDSGTGLANGSMIPENGTLVLGQEQDRVGGAFSESESFMGQLSSVAMWDKVLQPKQVWDMATLCDSQQGGNIFNWPQFLGGIKGNLQVENSTFCTKCSSLTSPIDGLVTIVEDKAGKMSSVAIYSCDDGHILKENGHEVETLTRRCLKQGQWEGKAPICIRRSCGFPGYFPKGVVQGQSYRYTDTLRYQCKRGSKLVGAPVRVCLATGQWSGTAPICQGPTCKVLDPPQNGRFHSAAEDEEVGHSPQVGQQLEAVCDPGYHLIGHDVLTCLGSGQWDDDVPVCESTSCEPPPRIPHGVITKVPTNNLPPTAVNSSKGSAVGNGTSTGEGTGSNETSSYQFGETVQYDCLPGFKLVTAGTSSAQLTCTHQRVWNGSAPSCVLSGCSKPLTLENGSIKLRLNSKFDKTQKTTGLDESESYAFGSKIDIECVIGFHLVGPKVRRCLNSGAWSSITPYCKQIKCDLKNLPFYSESTELSNDFIDGVAAKVLRNGTFITQGNHYGDVVTFKCNPGFQLVKDLKRNSNDAIEWNCLSNATWGAVNYIDFAPWVADTELPICNPIKVECSQPKIPENAYTITTILSSLQSLKVGSKVTYKCRQGYQLHGTAQSVCQLDGTWSNRNVSCEPVECQQPPTLTGAVLATVSDQYVYGNMVVHTCKEGFQAAGDLTFRCQANGKWTRIRGKCSKIFCGPPDVRNGARVFGLSYLYQDQVTYLCPQGTGSGVEAVLTCQSDGRWSEEPTCDPV